MSPNLVSKNIEGFEVHFRDNSVDLNVLDHSFDHDIFFKAIPDLAPDCQSVIDIGAHIGTFSLKASDLFPNAKVIAVEAFPETYHILEKNIEVNDKAKNIVAINKAVSDKNGTEKLFLDDENWGHSITSESSGKSVTITSCTLESIMSEQHLKTCDLVKFNCEGAEFRIILSTPKSLLQKVKMMVILFHEDLESAYSRTDLENYLRDSGFFLRSINQSDNRGWIIAKNRNYYSRLSDLIFRLKNGIKYRLKNL